MPHRILALLLAGAVCMAAPALAAKKALFDNTKAETAGQADWIIDDTQPVPSPAQSGITWASPESYWLGGISAWGVQLVKRGYTVHTLTTSYGITYGNASNPYDLSNYDLFVLPEPNIKFTAAESTAIFNYVRAGGGLFLVSDHNGSDRNNDGIDSPAIYDALDAGHLFGVHYGTAGDANNNIVQTSTVVNTSASDSIIHGPAGLATGIAYHNGTTFTLFPATNPTVTGDVWMTGVTPGSTTSVMFAHSVYGNGRVVFVGDSSPIDDGSGESGNTLYGGWTEAAGSAVDSVIFLNASVWATRRDAGDTTPPTITLSSPAGGESWKAGSSHAITWSASDNVGVTSVDLALSTDGGASYATAIATGLANSGSYAWTLPNTPSTTARVRATAHDAAGNATPAASAADFTIGQWTIAASAGPGGSIAPSGTIGLPQGGSQSFAITADPGQHVADVIVDGGSVGAVISWTFDAVSANHTIAASFGADLFTLTTPVAGSGSVTRAPDLASYASGTSVALTATADPGWSFAGWMGDTASSADPLTVVVIRNRSIAARFIDITPPLVSVTSPNGGEAWKQGDSHDITWTATDNASVDSVTIELSTSGPDGPWVTLANGLANTGTWTWAVSQALTDSALVRVTAWDPSGNMAGDDSDSLFAIRDPLTGAANPPATLAFSRPQPNPSSGALVLAFSLPSEGRARIEIFDAGGRRVAAHAEAYGAGTHTWRWDGGDTSGAPAHAGLYFARLVTRWGTRGQRIVRLN